MSANASISVPERIEIAEKRIIELKTLIDHWQRDKVLSSFWDNECSENPSSPSCLLFDN